MQTQYFTKSKSHAQKYLLSSLERGQSYQEGDNFSAGVVK
jgi:hypothetical protein